MITGIMISQYIGNHNRSRGKEHLYQFSGDDINRAYLSICFQSFQNPIVGMFTEEEQVIAEGSTYLGIISWTFIPLWICNISCTPLRCRDKSTWPLYIGIFSALLNTVLNYCFYIWKFCAPPWNSRRRICECHIPDSRSTDFIPVFCRLYGRLI